MAELITRFDLDRVNRSAARFDVKKLEALHFEHTRRLAPEAFITAAVPYLRKAVEEEHLAPQVVAQVEAAVAPVRALAPAPPRGRLAELADSPTLRALKVAARPITDRPEVARAAYRLGVLQDVYGSEDDSLRIVAREDRDCASCRACEAVCPTALPLAEIGVRTELPACTNCLQCWWVCPREAIRLEGRPNAMERQIGRYKQTITSICGAPSGG